MSLDDIVRIPAGITPHGEYHLLKGDKPSVSFFAHDGSIDFRIHGGLAAPFHDPGQPAVSVESLAALLAPWQFIRQKGATQHGETTVGNLGDPIEISAEVNLIGPNLRTTQRLVRAWIEANERMKTSELAVFTHDIGRWWVDARWAKLPPDKITTAVQRRQKFTQTWTVDQSFWRSYDSIDSFRLVYDNDLDTFDRVAADLGSGWDVDATGTGNAFIYANGNQAAIDLDDDPVLTGGRDIICRRDSFTTTGDEQVIEIVVGVFPGWEFPENAELHIWGRMKTAGDPGTDGIRASITARRVRVSSFVSSVETVLRDEQLALPPKSGERFGLVCGVAGTPRLFKVQRGGIEVLSTVESGTDSHIGGSYRGAGFGVHIGPENVADSTPPNVDTWSVGDNTARTRGGFIKLTNIGDQVMPPRYTCFGPGTFWLGNGPGSTDYVRFGPLLPNQVMQVNTDREQRPVVDMTSVAASPAEYNQYQRALNDFIGFATSGNVPLLFSAIRSIFGIVPPQAHPYSLLSGAFSNPVPPKPVGKPAPVSYIPVTIENGNANSMIVAAGTPLRRYPL